MRRKTCLIIVSFLLFLISCAKAPSIMLLPEEFELGTLSPGETVEDTVWVKNTGNGILRITVRSGCACIDIESAPPDSIMSHDSVAIAWVYYAPDSAQVDKNSILFSTNDAERKTLKLEIVAIIKPRRLARVDSTVTVLPLYIQGEMLKTVAQKTIQEFFNRAEKELGLHTVSPIELAQHVTSDHQYGKRPIEEVIRKWALMDSIRWVIACQVTQKDSIIQFSCALVDGFSEFPIPIRFDTDVARATEDFINNISDIYCNFGEHRRSAMMKGMQRKWMTQRNDIIGRHLPAIEFVDVMHGDTVDMEAVAGKPVVMHFFALDCDHCEEEMEWMRNLAETYPNDLVVWGVSVDMGKLDSVRNFAQAHDLPYTIMLPTDNSHRRLTRIYGGATPQTIVADANGKAVEFFVGFNDALTQKLKATIMTLGIKK